eukprot:jgi/Botrbrau1/9693/Bobra.0201s0023.1
MQEHLSQLEENLDNARDAIKVKEAMMDSANETISSLKAALSKVREEAAEAQQAARLAENELHIRQGHDLDRHKNLRMEIEAQETAMEEMERSLQAAVNRASEAEKRAAALEQDLKEKDAMLRYVDEEVQRVKDMFREKEQTLIVERDAAQAKGEAAQTDLASLRPRIAMLESQLASLPQELEAERAKAKLATDSEARAKEEAAAAGKRQRQVEGEMRALLTSLERQKAASAAKVKQLASVIQDLQGPFMSPAF